MQPYSLRELRAPAPRGYFLCKQKVTKKLPKPEVLDSSCFDFILRPRLGLVCLNLVPTASPDFCFCFGVS